MTGTSHRGGAWAGQVMLGLVVLMAAWAAGRAVSERRDRTRRAIEDTVQHVKIDERLRIAREMHDVVTHSMGLIAVKAGVANHVAREQPEEALDALTVIENVSRNALREMSVLLGVLRSDKDAGGDLRPLPRLSDLSEVVKAAEAAGVQVELTAPPGDTLPDGVALSTFRIVQEALTNVVKHAAPTRCRVSIATGPGSVSINVEDDGCESTAHPHRGDGGFGLLGMRERAAAHAGTVTAEPRPGRGFAVSAVLYY
jgi:signal transduction histidine kinase